MKLFIIPSWYPTKINPSSGSFFKERAVLLKDSGIDVIVIAPVLHSFRNLLKYNLINQSSFDKRIPSIINEKINIFPKNERLSFYSYQKQAIKLFNKAIQKYGKPDMVMFNSSIWSGAALYKKLNEEKIPFIISEHLKEFLIPNGFSNFNQNLIQKTYNSCVRVLSTSTALKKSILKKFKIPVNKIELVPNPIDESIFSLKPSNNNKIFSITSVSLFRQEKNIDLIIKAFDKMLKLGIDAKLNIVGDGPLRERLKKQINRLNNSHKIKLWGYLPPNQLVRVLHQTDIFVMGSSLETFGVALIEAQACGIPAVATKCGGPNDIILKDTGILVNPNSEFDLSRGIQEIIKNLNFYNSENIRKKTIERFGKNIYCNAIKKILL